METSRPVDSLENLRGRCNRGSVGEARSPSGGKSFFSNVLLLFTVSFILEVDTLMAFQYEAEGLTQLLLPEVQYIHLGVGISHL